MQCPFCEAEVRESDRGTFCKATGANVGLPNSADLHQVCADSRAKVEYDRLAPAREAEAERARRAARRAASAGSWSARNLGITR